jgi:hypothetical protein
MTLHKNKATRSWAVAPDREKALEPVAWAVADERAPMLRAFMRRVTERYDLTADSAEDQNLDGTPDQWLEPVHGEVVSQESLVFIVPEVEGILQLGEPLVPITRQGTLDSHIGTGEGTRYE